MPSAQQKYEDDFAKLFKAVSGKELKNMPAPTSLKKKGETVEFKKKKNAKDRIMEEKKRQQEKKNTGMPEKEEPEPMLQGEIIEVIPDDLDDDIYEIPDTEEITEEKDQNTGNEERKRPERDDVSRKEDKKETRGREDHKPKKQKEQRVQDNREDEIEDSTSELSEEESLRQPIPLFEIPESLAPYIEIEDCSKFIIERYYVTKAHMDIRDAVVRNQQMVKEFRKIGLNYLNSTMLYGVPGTGKTVMCRWLSYNLHIPFVYINFAKMIDGVFGNTARNITDVFRFLQDKECIFLIDEIDCVATKRGTESAATGGELSRITITIMQELDRYRRDGANCILLAATNRADMLDAALLSRFSIMHEMKPLNVREKEEYIRKFLDDVKVPYDVENIRDYATTYIQLRQRNVEADIIRCIADWIDYNKIQGIERPYILNHHDED